jgi:hypothetical protein
MQSRLALAAVLALGVAACSGDDGKHGIDGVDGADGADGTNGKDGADGKDGAKGATGATGPAGADGKDGANGNDVILSEAARLGLTLSEVPVDLTDLTGDEVESVGRGSYLVNAVADCKGCHNGTDNKGNTLFLAGNVDFPIGGFDSNGAPCTIGNSGCVDSHVFTRNLTPDKTTGLKLSEEQFVTALRTGRDYKDSTGATSLIVMPWPQLRWMTDRDLRDIYHYLRKIPAVSNAVQKDVKPKFPPDTTTFADAVPKFQDGAVARDLPSTFDFKAGEATTLASEPFDTNNVLRGIAISPLADDGIVASMSAEQQALYGRGSYIVNGPGLCNECHTPGGRNLDRTVKTAQFLSGGQAFAVPPPLQPLLKQVRTVSGDLTGDNGFTLPFSMFLQTLVSGASFTGSVPHALGFPMPFDVFRNMTVADKQAVYTYITTIQASGLVTGEPDHQAPARYCETATAATDCPGAGEACTAVTILGTPTHECTGTACTSDADCGACQACDIGNTNKCLAEDPASACVTTSF